MAHLRTSIHHSQYYYHPPRNHHATISVISQHPSAAQHTISLHTFRVSRSASPPGERTLNATTVARMGFAKRTLRFLRVGEAEIHHGEAIYFGISTFPRVFPHPPRETLSLVSGLHDKGAN